MSLISTGGDLIFGFKCVRKGFSVYILLTFDYNHKALNSYIIEKKLDDNNFSQFSRLIQNIFWQKS